MKPDYDEIRHLARTGAYRRIPVYRELLSDRFTPVEVMRTLRAASTHCYLLESADSHQRWGRYTFLGYDPTVELTCTNGRLRLTGSAVNDLLGMKEGEFDVGHPGAMIQKILKAYKSPGPKDSPALKELPPFTGGLVGYFSYEYIQYGEPALKKLFDESGDFCDVDLMLFDKVLAFDHYRQKIILIARVNTAKLEESYKEAVAELDCMEKLLESGAKAYFKPLFMEGALTPVFSEEQFCSMVARAKHYIHEGDIFQVVLSDPMEAKASGSLFDAYRVLRTTNPSPYMFYFSSASIEIAGASPETLVKLENGKLYTFPLAGTRPRGRDAAEDERLSRELLADEKERAEHNMLVDLGRNDLGKISTLGSVAVEKYMEIQRFSHVMHIGTTVCGALADGKSAVDAVDAILPAGTLSGAPKLRACEIIRELEGRRRGVYGGAIGYLDFTGNLDTCIAIRLAYKKYGRVCVQSGAGIVADSIPQKEFEECKNKARAVINALTAAQGGIQ